MSTPPCENQAMNDNVMTVAGGGGRRNDASSSASPLPMNPKMVAENEPTPHEPWKNGEKKARPHPGLLPPGEGIVVSASGRSERLTFARGSGVQCAKFLRKIFSRSRRRGTSRRGRGCSRVWHRWTLRFGAGSEPQCPNTAGPSFSPRHFSTKVRVSQSQSDL